MSAAELKYLIAIDALCRGNGKARLTDIANRLGVTKVSVYRMAEKLTAMGLTQRDAKSRIAPTAAGKASLAEYMLCVGYMQKELERCCRLSSAAAYGEAIRMVCAVGENSRSAMARFVAERAE